jgi:iron complex outermembrane receptor protein
MVLKRNLLTLAVASILASSLAHAQTAPAQPGAANAAEQETPPKKPGDTKTDEEKAAELGEIKVTGVRAAIERAISVKQNANEIVEAISAEDIGKLPDNSIAESLERIPGLVAQRIAGRASTVSVRGFNGDFSGTLLNGREQVSTGDNRGIEFDQYPSELLSGVTVYKTPDAALVGQGIAGTIAMQSVRPLDYDKRVIQLGARGEMLSNSSVNANTDSKGYRVNGAYIDQYLDHTLGLAIGYARLKSPTQDTRWESWGYTDITVPPGTTGDTAGGTVKALGGNKVYADSTEGTRDAILATGEWRPNDQFTSTLDIYYSKFNQQLTYGGFEFGMPWGCCGNSLRNPIVSNGLLVGGLWTVQPVLREELDHHDDKIRSIGWNNKLRFGDGWTASSDLSYAKANTNQSFLEEYAGASRAGSTLQDNFYFSQDPTTGVPHYNVGLNYADPNLIKLSDPGGWGQDGYIKFPKVSDELKAARFDLSKDINSPISKLSAGINYNERTKTRDSTEYFLDLKGGAKFADIPSSCLQSSTYLGYVGFPSIVSWDVGCVYGQAYAFNADGTPSRGNNQQHDVLNKDWSVQEKVGTAYFKADIDTEVASMPLRGNVGVQYVHAEQDSTAFAQSGGVGYNYTSPTTSYGNWLPNTNLVLTLPMDNYIRFGAGREIARPRLDYMKASLDYGINPNPTGSLPTQQCTNSVTGLKTTCRIEGSGGNPALKPFQANAYDLSWEKYWETKAYVAATFFFKSINTFVYNKVSAHDFSGVSSAAFGNLVPDNLSGFSTQWTNGSGGYMRGLELSASMPLDVLWAPLEGFGVQGSYADTQSHVCIGSSCGPFPGLSKYVMQGTAYYERAGFSARISAVHRSNYLGEVQAFGADQELHAVHAETVTDFQLGYQIQQGSWQGVNFLLQVQNLFNEPYREIDDSTGLPRQYTLYGRRYLLGVNYKF